MTHMYDAAREVREFGTFTCSDGCLTTRFDQPLDKFTVHVENQLEQSFRANFYADELHRAGSAARKDRSCRWIMIENGRGMVLAHVRGPSDRIIAGSMSKWIIPNWRRS